MIFSLRPLLQCDFYFLKKNPFFQFFFHQEKSIRAILTFEVLPALGLLGKTYCPELKLINIFSICGIKFMQQPKENGVIAKSAPCSGIDWGAWGGF